MIMFLKEKTEPNQLRFGSISMVAGVRLELTTFGL